MRTTHASLQARRENFITDFKPFYIVCSAFGNSAKATRGQAFDPFPICRAYAGLRIIETASKFPPQDLVLL